MDAPLHFVENGRPIDQIPMEQLAGNGKMNSSFYHLGGLSFTLMHFDQNCSKSKTFQKF